MVSTYGIMCVNNVHIYIYIYFIYIQRGVPLACRFGDRIHRVLLIKKIETTFKDPTRRCYAYIKRSVIGCTVK